MKKLVCIILSSFVLFACTKTEVEEIEDFSGDSGTFVDSRDGHVYKWVRIGDQIWMAENLAYLPVVYPPVSGSKAEPRYYIYDYTGSDVTAGKQNDNYTNFGVLYNWSAAKAASPPDWHLPSDEEWKQLEMALGMTADQVKQIGWRGNEQGTLMKSTRAWDKNGNGTNTSGFSAFPGGYRGISGSFGNIGIGGYWWSATESKLDTAWYRVLHSSNGNVSRYFFNTEYGFSVRCVKD